MKNNSASTLATSITKSASTQTFYTIRTLVDRELIPDAYRAYAYFRWVDDTLDQDLLALVEFVVAEGSGVVAHHVVDVDGAFTHQQLRDGRRREVDITSIEQSNVLLADIGLNIPDFRAQERIFALLVQVAGRCGRGGRSGY